MKHSLHTSMGITLVELMLALTLMAIIMSFGMPAWRHLTRYFDDQALLLALKNIFYDAQREAALHHFEVGVCSRAKDGRCQDEWGSHIKVFNAATHELIKQAALPLTHGTLHMRSYPKYRTFILFKPNLLDGDDNGTVWHCHNQTLVWSLVFNQAGQIHVVYPGPRVDLCLSI